MSQSESNGVETYLGRVLKQVQQGMKQLKMHTGASVLTNVLNHSTDALSTRMNQNNLKDTVSSFVQFDVENIVDQNGSYERENLSVVAAPMGDLLSHKSSKMMDTTEVKKLTAMSQKKENTSTGFARSKTARSNMSSERMLPMATQPWNCGKTNNSKAANKL